MRALALHTQGLTTANGKEKPPTSEAIYQTVERLGCIQIDTLHMVQRSHYLVLWSRLGKYDPAEFERLIYDPEQRRLFEYWKHAASIIPLDEYRYSLPHKRWFRNGGSNWFEGWLQEEGNQDLVREVLERVRLEGPVRAADFDHEGPRRGAWWDWKPAKRALERLYDVGDLMIGSRINFQRVYDLSERVLPEWVDTREPTLEERNHFRVEQAVRALGICQPIQAAEYAYLKRSTVKPVIEKFMDEGVFVAIKANLADGDSAELIVHRENLAELEKAASGAIQPQRTTFLSPFDSLFWARERDEQFWNFRNRLEAYKPEPARIWGYFCLPILHRDRLVGRFDPKLERQKGILRLRALHLEPGIPPEDEMIADIAAAMRDFLAFHGAAELVVERSQPEEFGVKLINQLVP